MKISMVLFFVLLVTSLTGLNSRANIRNSGLTDNVYKYHSYHVSVDGNDANAGTKITPLRTISAAQ